MYFSVEDIVGANDPRVLKEEYDQIVESLNEMGRQVEHIVLDNEVHGFSKKKIKHSFTLKFFDQ